jgi:hypothetical protein
MTVRLKISLAANLILAGLVVWLAHPPKAAVTHGTAAETKAAEPEARMARPASHPDQATAMGPFRWSQLVSSDYRVFIRNLRNIGCPEGDIRAIVTVDADQAFAFKRRELHLADSDTGPWSWQAEQQVIASLLGEPMPTVAQEPAPVAQPVRRALVKYESAPVLPLIFQPVDELNLTEVQKQVLADLQLQFLDEIGGPDQDPSDPAYLARWQAAQPNIDQSLKGLLGSQLYIKLRLLSEGYPVSP